VGSSERAICKNSANHHDQYPAIEVQNCIKKKAAAKPVNFMLLEKGSLKRVRFEWNRDRAPAF
jgi:hypothetical protein